MRLVAVFTVGLVDTAAAVVLSRSVACGLVVALAGGWAAAQHDHLYQRARQTS